MFPHNKLSTWRKNINNKLKKSLDSNYIDKLPSYAYSEPPLFGMPMVILEMPVSIGKRNRQDDIYDEFLCENENRQKYNQDIRLIFLIKKKADYGVIRNAFYNYLRNYNVFPKNYQKPRCCICMTCKNQFLSRNKMFEHLRDVKHFYDGDNVISILMSNFKLGHIKDDIENLFVSKMKIK